MNPKLLYSVYFGGLLHVGWALFHLLFPRVFKWKDALADMDPINRNIYQVVNLCLVFFFMAAAYLSLVFGGELLAPGLGRKLLAIFGAFWLMRFGLQMRFFRPSHPASLILSLLFLITSGAYLYPLMQGAR